jgi:hypothetical protein
MRGVPGLPSLLLRFMPAGEGGAYLRKGMDFACPNASNRRGRI